MTSIETEDQVLVVASKLQPAIDWPGAWQLYQRIAADLSNEISAYICQPRRRFRNLSRLAFCSGGIEPLVPRVLAVHEEVEFTNGQVGDLGKVVNCLLKNGLRNEGDRNKVILLTSPGATSDQFGTSDTIRLRTPIPNRKTDKNGAPCAFTFGHRYVRLSRLLRAKDTTDLER